MQRNVRISLVIAAFLVAPAVGFNFGHISHVFAKNVRATSARTSSRFRANEPSGAPALRAVTTMAAGPVQSLQTPPCPKDGVALVIFSGAGDLRVHDHG